MSIFKAILFCFWTVTPAWAYEMPKPLIDHLSNGMTVAWFIQDSRPLVDLSLVIKRGTKDDQVSGSTALLTNIIQREVGGRIDELGGAHSAQVDGDTTAFWVHGLDSDFLNLTQILSDMAFRSPLEPTVFEQEFFRTLDGIRHLSEETSSLADVALARYIKNGTVYAGSGFAGVTEFKKIKREALLQLYRELVVPANSILVIAGRVDRAKALPLLEEKFGKMGLKTVVASLHSAKAKKINPQWIAKKDQIVIVSKPGSNQVTLKIGKVVGKILDPDYVPLQVGNVILGELFNSRLNSVIRDQLGLTYGIGSTFSYDRDLGVFFVSCATRTEAIGTVLKKTQEILTEFAQKGPTDQELAVAKDYVKGNFALSLTSLQSVAGKWLGMKIMGLNDGYWDQYLEKVSRVTVSEVLQAFKVQFATNSNQRPFVTVISGDAPGVETSLKKVGFKSITRVSLDSLIK